MYVSALCIRANTIIISLIAVGGEGRVGGVDVLGVSSVIAIVSFGWTRRKNNMIYHLMLS